MLLKREALTLVVLCLLVLNIVRADEKNAKAGEKNAKADEKNVKADEKNVKADEKNIKADEKNVKVDEKVKADGKNVTANDRKAKADDENLNAEEGNEFQSCGVSGATKTHSASNIGIIQAREAEKRAWPWVAEVYISKRNRKDPSCGGVLISRSYVITAGHCLVSRGEILDPRKVSVRLGDHDLESEKDGMKPVNLSVESIHVHEEYDHSNFMNDIALLRLEKPVNFSTHIQPLCLPDDSDEEEDMTSAAGYVAGWGISSSGDPFRNVLTEMSAIIIDDKICRDAYEGLADITEENICTVGVNGSSPCHGFGGAPLMLPREDHRFYLAGIVSYGIGCGNPEYPDVNTKVAKFLDWIQQIMT